MTKKLFTEKQASVAAVLAGPIPAGILIYLNYKALGKEKEAFTSMAVTLIFTVLLFYGIFQLPNEVADRIPNAVFTGLYGLIVYLFFRHCMSPAINQALEEGAIVSSNWTVAGFSLVGLILNLAIIYGLAIDEPFYEGEMTELQGNQLYYDANIPPSDVSKLLSQLEAQDFFGPDYGNIARLQLIGDDYTVTLLVDEELWADADIISYVTNLKWLMEVEFGQSTNLKLESVSIAGQSTFKVITY